MRIEAPALIPDFSRDVHCLLGLPIDAVNLATAEQRIRAAAASHHVGEITLISQGMPFAFASRPSAVTSGHPRISAAAT